MNANKPQLDIGLIGAGWMGMYHAHNLHKHIGYACVGGISDPDEERRRLAAESCGKPRIFADARELIRSPDIDAVIICTPDATHAALVQECLDAQKPVLCEKPLAATLTDAVAIIEKENAIGKKYVSVGFQRRFDGAHREAKATCMSGTLGSPLLWKGAQRLPSTAHPTGQSILLNSAGHDIDSARWLLASDVAAVSVKGRRSRNDLSPDATDLLLIQMDMVNGALASAEIYANALYGYEVLTEVLCQNGSVTTTPPGLIVTRGQKTRGAALSDDFRGYFQQAYLSEMVNWIDYLQNDAPFDGADAWDGYAAVAVAHAANTALAEDRTVPVSLIEKPELYR